MSSKKKVITPKSKNGGKMRAKTSVRFTPAAINNTVRSSGPKMVNERGVTVVSHREVLDDSFSASALFAVNTTHAIQPALQSYSHGSPIGAWLAGVARQYDRFKFRSLKLHYVTAAPSTAVGNILMCADPNPEGSQPVTLAEARSMHAIVGPVRENLTLDLSDIVRGKELLTRSGAVTSYPAYDAGRIFICSFLGGDVPVGYIEVSYTIELKVPQLAPRVEVGFVSSVAPPAVMFSDTLVGNSSFQIGTGAGAANCTGASVRLLRGDIAGDVSLVTVAPVFGNNASIQMVIVRGVTYRLVGGATVGCFKPNRVGRYLVETTLVGDVTDYATYAVTVLKTRTTGTLAEAMDITVDSNSGLPLEVFSSYTPGRGFTNPTITGDDTGLVHRQTFYHSGAALDYYTVAMGIRNIAAIAENGTASFVMDSSYGYGVSSLKITFLGTV